MKLFTRINKKQYIIAALLFVLLGIGASSFYCLGKSQNNVSHSSKEVSIRVPNDDTRVEKRSVPLEKKKINEKTEKTENTTGNKVNKEVTSTAEKENQEAANNESTIYKYCPSSINGNVLYCSNLATPGEVKDGICINGYRVLAPTSGSWDSVQVCDPSVVQGQYTYNGSTYQYLMAYLGCSTYDCTNNEIGFAVSNDLCNWNKVGKVVSSCGGWGVGQPSLVVKNGTTFLFYTQGTPTLTSTLCRQLNSNDLSSVNLSEPVTVRNMAGDFISNADFAVSGDELYMTCDTHVNYMFPAGALSNISQTQSVYVTSWNGDLGTLQSVSWNRVAAIGPGNTGHNRNHNGCFIRDGAGNLAERAILVSTADEVGDFKSNLWTYRFQKMNF